MIEGVCAPRHEPGRVLPHIVTLWPIGDSHGADVAAPSVEYREVDFVRMPVEVVSPTSACYASRRPFANTEFPEHLRDRSGKKH